MSVWDKLKSTHSSAVEALSTYIQENNTWDEMRKGGSHPIGTNKESADYIANFLGDPINMIFTALGIGSSYRYITNPKKLLSFVDKVSDAHKTKTAKVLVEQEKIVNNFVNSWENNFIKNNVIPQIHMPHFKNIDPTFANLRKLSIPQLRGLPKSEFFKSPELASFINSYKSSMLDRRPWRYSNNRWMDLQKSTYEDHSTLRNAIRKHESFLVNEGKVVKEYGSLSPTTGKFEPAGYEEMRKIVSKNVESMKKTSDKLRKNWNEIKDSDIFSFIK